MKDIKKFIMILIGILVILMIIIVAIMIKLKNLDANPVVEEIKINDIILNKTIERVTVRNDYFTVKNIVDQYYLALCNLNKKTDDVLILEGEGDIGKLEEVISKEKENLKKRIYNFFDKDFINNTGLTVNNIQEKLGNYNNLDVLFEDIYVRDISVNLKIYFVSGILTKIDTLEKENFKLVIALDSNNSTFNIYTSEFAKEKKLEDVNSEFNISEIENRLYNKYKYKIVNDEDYAKELLKSYTQSIRYNNINYSYIRLDEEYKNKRFKEKGDYEKYIQENRNKINMATLKYYEYKIFEGYIQYICVDQDEKYYIFNQTEIMNYKLILDPYTIEMPEFIDKYEEADDKTKVALNIEKLVEASKMGDYIYIYNKLDESFKANNYKTIIDFEKFMKGKFDATEDTIKYDKYQKVTGVHVYNVVVTDKSENKKINAKVVMDLKENRDFVFSFSVEN